MNKADTNNVKGAMAKSGKKLNLERNLLPKKTFTRTRRRQSHILFTCGEKGQTGVRCDSGKAEGELGQGKTKREDAITVVSQ